MLPENVHLFSAGSSKTLCYLRELRVLTDLSLKKLAPPAQGQMEVRTIQDYLGHRDPKHTVHYTRVAGRRSEGLWK